MPKTLQFRRDTTQNLSSVTGAAGELFVDTTKNTVVVSDGATAGGFALARENIIRNGASNVSIIASGGNIIANVNGVIAANIGSSGSWFGSNVSVGGILTNNYYYANGAAVSFGGGNGISGGTSTVSIPVDNGCVFITVAGTTSSNIGFGRNWFNGNIIATGGILTNNYYYANGAAVSFGGSGATISQVSDFNTYYLVGTSSTSGSLSTASINTQIRFVPFSPVLYVGTYTTIAGPYIQTQYLSNTAGSSGTAGQVLTSGGSGANFYWSTPSAGGGGGTLAIGNLVYLMWQSGPTYYLARGWVYKSSKGTSPSSSVMYFRFYDGYTSASLNPGWTTVAAAAPSWGFAYSESSNASFASAVGSGQLYGLEFYTSYNYAGSTSVMPVSPSMATGAAATLKYPSGGLSLYTNSLMSGFNGGADPSWGYAPNFYINFFYVLDGTQDSKIATFNYP